MSGCSPANTSRISVLTNRVVHDRNCSQSSVGEISPPNPGRSTRFRLRACNRVGRPSCSQASDTLSRLSWTEARPSKRRLPEDCLSVPQMGTDFFSDSESLARNRFQ